MIKAGLGGRKYRQRFVFVVVVLFREDNMKKRVGYAKRRTEKTRWR